MGRDRYKIVRNAPHFITLTILKWIPLFSNPKVAQIILDSLRFMQNENRMIIYGYVIMENHMHMVISSDNLADEIAKFKSYTARKIVDYYEESGRTSILEELFFHKLAHKKDRDYQVWQEGSHPEIILGDKMLIQKMDYIHANPVRRGYVDYPEQWRYSSARSFANQKGLIELKGWERMKGEDREKSREKMNDME